ncbi:hypothetical protein MUU47_16070 [Scandinavium sp. H11S7]|uniref:Uncharacterized protein n=1 Tax=Scandinavium hiltneri TaxID=2926519 RepID=A0ABT2E401_9ENTR|nr:hypothetical protein [Scandinavium hiltneri]MCS2162607.1 hypothetical protein [Scandinavium hiltneri]
MNEHNPKFFLLSRGLGKNNSCSQNGEVMSDKGQCTLPDISFTAKYYLHGDINWFTSERALSPHFPLCRDQNNNPLLKICLFPVT